MASRVKMVEIVSTYKVPDLESRVDKGIALLDQKVPGWDKKIQMKELDLQDGSQCVVGQLALQEILNGATGYTDGAQWLLGEKWEQLDYQYGFNLDDETTHAVEEMLKKAPDHHPWKAFESIAVLHSAIFDLLTTIWIQKIKARRAARRAKPVKKAVARTRGR